AALGGAQLDISHVNSDSRSGMSVFVILGGSLLTLYVAASVLLSNGNTMGSLFYYMLIGGGVFGLMAPRKAFFLFLLQCACLDFAKRLMILAGSVSHSDLYFVLGIAPVTVAGIATGLVIRVFFGQVRAGGDDFLRLMIAGVIMAAGAFLGFRGGGGLAGMMKTVAEGYFYSILIFVIPLLFPTARDIRQVWGFTLMLFTPVAIYGICQQLFGYQEFEIDYLKTGLSIEVKQLVMNRVRAFSTLNSPTSLSLICSELAAVALLLAAVRKRDRQLGLLGIAAFGFAAVFIGGWLASTVRVGILVVPVALVAAVLFRSGRLTVAFYAFCLIAFAGLVASSSYILMNVESWTMKIHEWTGNNDYLANMLDANTYKDRLMGFVNVLGNPAAYSLFGLGEDQMHGDFYNHDPLSTALVKYGALPVAGTLMMVIPALVYLHRSAMMIRHEGAQRLAIACLAVAAGSVAVSMIGGNLIATFPGNAFLAMPIGMVIALRRTDQQAAAVEEGAEPEKTPSNSPPLAQPWAGQRVPWQAAAPPTHNYR
ncbi:MAG TPA: hypothetical protein VD994_14660, partial [Prosthecobacter sp.]|nr:hypothetical protein [Prosthecobacter sp.]